VFEIRRYTTTKGRDVVGEWLLGLGDAGTRAKIALRIDRLELGSFGDCKPLRQGVWELRIDHGPGYRLYYGMIGKQCVLLLGGGDKRKQSADITRAVGYFKEYKARMS
jgi:putative addiction module killer protein